MSSVVTSLVKASVAASLATATSHRPNDNTQGVCYSCVDDHQIPPCAGFSQDYSCLPETNKTRR